MRSPVSFLLLLALVAAPAGAVTYRCAAGADPSTSSSDDSGFDPIGTDGDPVGAGSSFRNLAYGDAHDRQVMDLYLPEGEGPHPVVMFIHGGGFAAGDKSQAFGFDGLVSKGYAFATINYTLLPKDGMANVLGNGKLLAKATGDCREAVRFLRRKAGEYRLDARRIGVFGVSAGGYYASMLGALGEDSFEGDPSQDGSAAVQAVVDYAGPTSFGSFAGNMFAYRQDPARQRYRYAPPSSFSFDISGIADQFLQGQGIYSAVDLVDGDHPPTRIIHGHQDNVVPVEQSTVYRKALEDAGVDVEIEILEGEGHILSPPAMADQLEKIGAFLDRILR